MKKVLNLDPEGFSKEGIRLLKNHFAYFESDVVNLDIGILKNFNIIIVKFGLKFDKDLLSECKSLEILACPATGVDHIDSDYCNSRGIKVISLAGEDIFLKTIHSSAEHTWALLCAIYKNIVTSSNFLKLHKVWDRNKFKTRDLFGKTIGIVGYGRNGKKIANFAEAFGKKVKIYDKLDFSDVLLEGVNQTSLIDLVKLSDIIVLTISLNTFTKGLINGNLLSHCAKMPVIINTSRGEIVVEADIIEALESGKISKYATDVLINEYDKNFLECSLLYKYSLLNDDVLITPHIAGANIDSWEKADLFISNKIIEIESKYF